MAPQFGNAIDAWLDEYICDTIATYLCVSGGNTGLRMSDHILWIAKVQSIRSLT